MILSCVQYVYCSTCHMTSHVHLSRDCWTEKIYPLIFREIVLSSAGRLSSHLQGDCNLICREIVLSSSGRLFSHLQGDCHLIFREIVLSSSGRLSSYLQGDCSLIFREIVLSSLGRLIFIRRFRVICYSLYVDPRSKSHQLQMERELAFES